MPSAGRLVAGDANPRLATAAGVAGDKPRVNSGGFDPGFDPLTCGPKRLVS